jgi:peptidoglycan/LPS O-acetylase OafA/YrhL
MSTDGRQTVPTAARPGHLPSLDGLRAVAILAVFAYHTVRTDHADGLAAKILIGLSGGGWMGVDLFFVLSGFLITGILLETRGGEGYYRSFVLRRALRILPLYYAALITLLVATAVLRGTAGAEGAELRSVQGWYWTHLVNLLVARDGFPGAPLHTGHLWSLAVEEQFYLLWPLVVATCSMVWLRRVCLGMIGLAVATRIGIVSYVGGSEVIPAAYVLPIARLDTLAMGAWLAIVARQPNGLQLAWPRIRQLGMLGLVALAVVGVSTRSLQWGTWPMQTIGYTAVALVAAATLVLVVIATGTLREVMTARPLTHVGRRSYALYVLHYPLISLAGFAGLTGDTLSVLVGSQTIGLLLWMTILFATSLALAELSWVAIERRCLLIKEKIARRPNPTEAYHGRSSLPQGLSPRPEQPPWHSGATGVPRTAAIGI